MQRFLIRVMDIVFSLAGLCILLPVWLVLSIWIKIDSPGAIFYRQTRIGKGGVPFSLIKFRTMVTGADRAGLLTVGGKDARITKSGVFLRKYKLDELPQLWNVFIGDMSMVGPRPEVSKYTTLYTDEQRKILDVRPGITDQASIVFRNESDLLARQSDPEAYYIETIIPQKIAHNLHYVQHPTLSRYFALIAKTLLAVVRG